MTETMTYARYLALDDLLACQHPRSDCDDEMLFIVIHQTKELWLKQMIRELRLGLSQVRADQLVPAYKALARVSRIQAVMTLSWDVLATMTPSDYSRFRNVLGPSSGFQSDQFRTVEYMLGLKDGRFLSYQDDRPEARATMELYYSSGSHASLAGAISGNATLDDVSIIWASGKKLSGKAKVESAEWDLAPNGVAMCTVTVRYCNGATTLTA